MSQLSQDKNENIRLVIELSMKASENRFIGLLTAAQAILESGLESDKGPSQLAFRYNNLFGIKGPTDGRQNHLFNQGTATPGIVYLKTTEYINGKPEIVRQPFLANQTVEDSIKQHQDLLTKLDRYKNIQSAKSFEEAAHLIKEDGYCTDPNYPRLLIEIYNKYLKDLDK